MDFLCEVGRFIRGFALLLAIIFIGIPLSVVAILLLFVYIITPGVVGLLAGMELYSMLHATALSYVAGIVVALFGWYVEWYVNDRTTFPYAMLDEAGW